ncbi:tetratricopeptide (TPR) repeat protein [Duganella sp. SG902]|uniref:tetratricopeptide repeat protein n=1 Tax=Duganella sp. SG902 TaxID=2587016 RepID=UPI00159DB52F|nr:tetratricopeptide repeat protein [Duganella sp. SG902]NVM76790.1 tetratricopeptide (TPR) repeat protein [Duganella sp. SG902]
MKKIIALLLALVCVAGHAQGLVPINAEAEALIHQGHALQTQGKYKEAFEKFSAAAQADPQASLPLSSIAGMLLSMAKQTQEAGALKLRQQAEDMARQALQKHANDPVAMEVLRELADDRPLPLHQPTPEAAAALHEGELLFTQRKLDEALAHYERAAALDPNYSQAWIYAGDCYYFQKKFAEAEQRFRKGVEVEPLNSQGWRFLADALAAQGKPGPAEGALMGGIAAQPSQMPNWVKLNQLRTNSGFPLTPLNLVRKAKGQLDPATRTLNLTVDPSLKGADPARQPDAGLWLALATQQAIEGKAGASPFAIELAAWRKALQVADELSAQGGGELQDPALKTMRRLAQADQLEPALLLLQYKESWRAEFEAWKSAHPDGVRKFIDAYQLRP